MCCEDETVPLPAGSTIRLEVLFHASLSGLPAQCSLHSLTCRRSYFWIGRETVGHWQTFQSCTCQRIAIFHLPFSCWWALHFNAQALMTSLLKCAWSSVLLKSQMVSLSSLVFLNRKTLRKWTLRILFSLRRWVCIWMYRNFISFRSKSHLLVCFSMCQSLVSLCFPLLL